MPGYTTYRTAAPAWVRLARGSAATNAGFLALILGAGYAVDRLVWVLMTALKGLTQ